MILLCIILFFFTFYTGIILFYWLSWKSVPDFVPESFSPHTKISVIIPARNEEENIGKLLTALREQSYPKELREIIVIDDNSEDKTASIVAQFPEVQLITFKENNINSYKKKALGAGVDNATGDFIITTDADCLPGKDWLKTIALCQEQKGSVFIAGPVVFTNDSSLLQVFQALDFLTLQGITAASVSKHLHSMCNGANLGYERKVFYDVNGFAGIDTIASGDDMLLMHKIWKQYPKKVHYLKSKEAIVSTQPMKTWKEFVNQRIRWASKARSYDDKRILPVLLIVYLFNLSFLVLLVAGFGSSVYWLWLAGLLVAKTIIELPFVYSVARFFDQQQFMWYFPFFQPLHIGYTILSGLLGQLGKYEWKGRKVK